MQQSTQTAFFNEHGYLAIKHFLSLASIGEVEKNLDSLIKTSIKDMPREHVFYEELGNTDTLKQIQRLESYSAFFHQLGHCEQVQGLAQYLLGGPVVLKNIQYFNKSPCANSATPAHQDGFYFKIIPQQAITMWLSLGDADANNGAVCYLPGSHKMGLRPHRPSNVLGFSQELSDWSQTDSANERQMTASAGDLLVHHSLTVHRANANSSLKNRRSIGLIFYRKDATVDHFAVNNYTQELTTKMQTDGQI